MKSFFRIAAAWCALAAAAALCADNGSGPEPLKGLVLWRDAAKSHPELSNAISLEFSYFLPCDAAVAQLAKDGYDPAFGARPVKRAIQRELENPIAKNIISGKYPPGAEIKVTAADGSIVV